MYAIFTEEEKQRYQVEPSRAITYENISYGMLVEVLDTGGGYHSGCKVHFFNKKGVLIGNYYEFVPYERLRLRKDYNGKKRDYQWFFGYGNVIGNAIFIVLLKVVSGLIRFTQKYMD
ncbi:MAG TPA: hypothetical protein VEA37_02710 [Flavobacterium sp.]|nr:hypothetical protein [Flavobacterium sp.]